MIFFLLARLLQRHNTCIYIYIYIHTLNFINQKKREGKLGLLPSPKMRAPKTQDLKWG